MLHHDPALGAYLARHPEFARALARGDAHVTDQLVRAPPNGTVVVKDFVIDPSKLHRADLPGVSPARVTVTP